MKREGERRRQGEEKRCRERVQEAFRDRGRDRHGKRERPRSVEEEVKGREKR